MGKIIITFLLIVACALSTSAKDKPDSDVFQTSMGELEITFVGHGTLYFTINNLVVHIDPVDRYADYSELPKADLILITHEHGDHLSKPTIEKIIKEDTKIILTQICYDKLGEGKILNNGESLELFDVGIEAVPAYNIVHKRNNGQPYHPKGSGNGYVIKVGDTKIYIAGDTENIPEMKTLEDIDIAFLPMNIPYTMTPEMVAEAVSYFNPKILYPYHYGNTDTDELLKLMKDKNDCEVRIRDLQ